MPRNPPPMGRRFQPGVSGNPNGAPPLKKRIKKLTMEQLEMILNQILLVDPKELNEVTKKDPTLLKTWIASIVSKGISKGDPGALNALLDRLIGKVTDKVKVTSSGEGTATPVVIYIPSNGMEQDDSTN